MERIEEIQSVLLKTNRVSHKHALAIAKLVTAVADGVKVGFIWDIGPPVTIHQVTELVNELRAHQLLSSDVLTVGVSQEICVLNKKLFLSSHLTSVFIDVTKTLEHPQILANDHNLNEMVKDIREQIERAEGSTTLNVVEESYCVPTIIGLLAGYPIVYWYKPCDGDAHCLSGLELQVYKVLQDNDLLSSFSCPKELAREAKVLEAIGAWEKSMKAFKHCRIESCVSKNEFTVNL